MAMLNCKNQIFIEALVLNMSIGIYDFEKQSKQRVIVDICLDVSQPSQGKPENIDDVVSYEEITKKTQKLSQSKHYDLVETFAEDISEICLSYKPVNKVKVKVGKPDIIEEASSVGVQILRQKS